MTQSIIVYRNPMEQALWETTFYGLPLPAWFAGIVLATILLVIVFHLCSKVMDHIRWRRNRFTRGW